MKPASPDEIKFGGEKPVSVKQNISISTMTDVYGILKRCIEYIYN